MKDTIEDSAKRVVRMYGLDEAVQALAHAYLELEEAEREERNNLRWILTHDQYLNIKFALDFASRRVESAVDTAQGNTF